jgi:CTP synthase (UTP-ammonia lyase)
MSPRIAVVGDFDPRNRTHLMTDASLGHIGARWEWVATESVGDDAAVRLGDFDGVWIGPASPYRSMEGALSAIRFARERGVPLVGT